MISHPSVKLNLGLSVLRKRPDGYHDIETLFIPYDGISDTLEIIPADAWSETSASIFSHYSAGGSLAQSISEDGKLMITIARREGVDWDPLKDLTAKAYRLLDEEFSLPSVKIFLEKTSPVGAGLGGGSSDAAFALRMLSDLFALGLSDEDLASRAARLGSDCAFFVYNRPMLGSGRGEVLEPYGIDLSAYAIKVVVPAGVAVSTADAYRGIVPRELSAPQMPFRDALTLPVERWRDSLVNDFEATVFKKYPEVAQAKQRLYDEGAVYASMSGSGSALFGLFKR